MKQPTKLIKTYLRQMIVSKKKHELQKILQFSSIKNPIQLNKEKHSKRSNFPRKLKLGNKIMTGEDEIATEFNKKLVDIGPSLAKLFPNPSLPLECFLKRVNITLHSQSLD